MAESVITTKGDNNSYKIDIPGFGGGINAQCVTRDVLELGFVVPIVEINNMNPDQLKSYGAIRVLPNDQTKSERDADSEIISDLAKDIAESQIRGIEIAQEEIDEQLIPLRQDLKDLTAEKNPLEEDVLEYELSKTEYEFAIKNLESEISVLNILISNLNSQIPLAELDVLNAPPNEKDKFQDKLDDLLNELSEKQGLVDSKELLIAENQNNINEINVNIVEKQNLITPINEAINLKFAEAEQLQTDYDELEKEKNKIQQSIGVFISPVGCGAGAAALRFINNERRKRGLKSLVMEGKLCLAAQIHANYMVKKCYLGHTEAGEYTNPVDRIKAAGYMEDVSDAEVGENVGWAQNAEEIFNAWMNSPGHRANIINPNYKQAGMAVRKNYQCKTVVNPEGKVSTVEKTTLIYVNTFGVIIKKEDDKKSGNKPYVYKYSPSKRWMKYEDMLNKGYIYSFLYGWLFSNKANTRWQDECPLFLRGIITSLVSESEVEVEVEIP